MDLFGIKASFERRSSSLWPFQVVISISVGGSPVWWFVWWDDGNSELEDELSVILSLSALQLRISRVNWGWAVCNSWSFPVPELKVKVITSMCVSCCWHCTVLWMLAHYCCGHIFLLNVVSSCLIGKAVTSLDPEHSKNQCLLCSLN